MNRAKMITARLMAALAGAGALLAACDQPQEAHYTATGEDGRARPAPRLFASADKGLVLRTPLGASYCPLPGDWVGADEGTTLYLTPPNCQSAEAGARPADPGVPSIRIAYRQRDPVAEETTCRSIGQVMVLGQQTPLCESRSAEGVTLWARAFYRGEGADNVAVFTLTTSAGRQLQDMAVFRSLLESASVCTRLGGAAEGVQPCPATAQYF